MLYEFHSSQNKNKEEAVLATYIIDGSLKPTNKQAQAQPADGEDSHMQSSPFMSSSLPQQDTNESLVPMRQITLASENHLAGNFDPRDCHACSMLVILPSKMPFLQSFAIGMSVLIQHIYIAYRRHH